ncbi:MAG: hypothetical protein DIJKHBIC_04479 [Thermoanaerobaculia bacterium]|nr:hypothetical protein [Thermoanaerobaculia bacterium]
MAEAGREGQPSKRIGYLGEKMESRSVMGPAPGHARTRPRVESFLREGGRSGALARAVLLASLKMVLAAIVCCPDGPPLLAQASYRSAFEAYRRFPGEPVLTTSSSASVPLLGGNDEIWGSASLSLPASFTGRENSSGVLLLDFPQQFDATVSYTHKHPVEAPETPHTAVLAVRMRDNSSVPAFDCAVRSPSRGFMSGGTASFRVVVSCPVAGLSTYNRNFANGIQNHYSDAVLSIKLEIDGKEAGGQSIYGTYHNFSTVDSISIDSRSVSPAPGTRLQPGARASFSAAGLAQVLSRPAGRAGLRLYDQRGVLQASSSPDDPVTKGAAKAVTLTVREFTIDPGVTRLELKGVLTDDAGGEVLAQTQVLSYPVGEPCTLSGRLFREGRLGTYPLPNASVEVWDVTQEPGQRIGRVQAELKGTFEAPDARYCFKIAAGLDTSRKYQPRVFLRDAERDDSSRFLVSAGSSDGGSAHELRWEPFSPSGTSDVIRDLEVGDGAPLVADAARRDVSYAAAETYWHVWRQVYLMMPVNTSLPLSRDLPLEVYLNGPNGISFYCATADPAGCLTPSSISLEPKDSVPGANPSVVWHEFGHHLLRELYGGELPRPAPSTDPALDRNHNGFANDYTCGSLDEGFATFWGTASSQVFETLRRAVFRWNSPSPENGGHLDPEHNYLAVGPVSGPSARFDEELAVAGLLWDLIDGAIDPPSGASGVSDTIDLSLKDVISVFSSRKPGSLLQLHGALAQAFPSLAVPSGLELSPLDQLFVLHGFFHDNNPADWSYSPGEQVGRAANGATWQGTIQDMSNQEVTRAITARPGRENLPQLKGAMAALAFVDEAGEPVPSASLEARFEFGPGFEGWNSSEVIEISGGSVYFQFPPPSYPVRAIFQVPDSPGPPLVVEGTTYWSKAGTEGELTSHTFVVPSLPVLTSLDPVTGQAGETVTLSGRNFSEKPAENQVLFGEAVSDIVSASADRLVVRVPAGAPPGPAHVSVRVRGMGGQSLPFTITAPSARLSANSLSFGSVAATEQGLGTVTLVNAGDAPLIAGAAAATNGRFSLQAPTLPLVIEPGGSRVLTLAFSPVRGSFETGRLHIQTNDPSRRTVGIDLSGTGTPAVAPHIAATPDAFDFGSVAAGTSSTTVLSIRNDGTGSLEVLSAVPAGPFSLASPSLPVVLQAGQEAGFTVRFQPATEGGVAGSLSLLTNVPGQSTFRLDLKGTGVAPPGAAVTLATDDGTVETGAVQPGLVVANRFTPAAYPVRLTAIRIFHALFQGQPSPAGAVVRLVAFVDREGVPVSPRTVTSLAVDQLVTLPAVPSGGGFVEFAVTNGPLVTSGDIYAGYASPTPSGGVVFAADSSGEQQRRGFFSTDGGSVFQGPLVFQSEGGQQTPVNMMIRAVLTPEIPSPCRIGLSHGHPRLGPGASSGTIEVTAPAGCAWTASSDASWLTVSPPSGTGSGSVAFQATENPRTDSRTGTVTVAGLKAGITQEAGDARASSLVPILLTSAGANQSFFTSELTLTNTTQGSLLAQLEYTPAFGGGGGAGFDVVPPGGQITHRDALRYLASTGIDIPASGDRGGTLRITVPGEEGRSPLAALARTTSVVPEGRAGLAYTDVPGQAGLTGPVLLCGLRQDGADRSNLALIHAGEEGSGDIALRVTVFSGDPTAPRSVTLPEYWIAPGGFKQITGVLTKAGPDVVQGYARVERVAGNAPYYTYAVVNDQRNSDGSFIPPFLVDSKAKPAVTVLPVIVETSAFSSELVATNFGSSPRMLRLAYLADAVTAPGNTAATSVLLAPGEQRLIPGFVAFLRERGVAGVGSGSFAGALFASVDGGDTSGVFLGARTSSEGGGGRYGLFYPAVPDGQAADSSAWIFGLRQDDESRSNLAIVHAGAEGSEADVFRLDIYDGGTGQLAATLEGEGVPARGFKQFTTILARHAPGTKTGYVKVTRTEGLSPFIVYGVVNDGSLPGERTGDGAYVPMSLVDEAP